MLKMTKISIISLLVGVLGVTNNVLASDQSETFTPNDEPIAINENEVGTRRAATPEVVLQLKYDKGELNKIYLAQFRKEERNSAPSVLARSNLCADLCHAGLGGDACGSTCPQMIPVGLRTALERGNKTEVIFGQPRFSVCPALCDNQLGEPLCNCSEDESEDHAVDWPAICSAFCVDGYTLGGCPNCELPSTSNPHLLAHRVLNTSEGWHAWCNVQCRQGQGGAACNCDMSPFQ